MERVLTLVISNKEPDSKTVGWLKPKGSQFRLLFWGPEGWKDIIVGEDEEPVIEEEKEVETDTCKCHQKYITELSLYKSSDGEITGGIVTRADSSTFPVTLTTNNNVNGNN